MAIKKNGTHKKHSETSGQEVRKEMHKFKQGTAHSGKGHTPVQSREQAVAIGLSKAREKDKDIPMKSTNQSSSQSSKSSPSGSSSGKRRYDNE